MAVPLKTLYLWHSGTLWWHCLGGSRTHQTSPICCQLLDRRTRLYSLRRKQAYCRINYSPSRCATREQMVVELRQCCSTLKIRVNKTGGRQPHRGFSWDPPAQCQSDGHRGGRWTSLSGATSEWAELCRETVRGGYRTRSQHDEPKGRKRSRQHLVNSSSGSMRGWWTTILFFSMRAV